jgi:hypothetical protein
MDRKKDIAKIACPGALADFLVIDQLRSECGTVKDGIGVRFDGDGSGRGTPGGWGTGAGFVLSWADFEAAYLKAKALREGSPSEGDGDG